MNLVSKKFIFDEMLTSTPKKTKGENDQDITELSLDTVELDSSRDEVFISFCY